MARIYCRERADCSTHGLPRSIAAEVILARAPAIGTDKAREMVDAMLAWVIARHETWFWTGLQGQQTIKPLLTCLRLVLGETEENLTVTSTAHPAT